PRKHLQVLAAAEGLVHGGVLTDESDPTTDCPGIASHVTPGHPGPATIRLQQRRQDAHSGGLPRAVPSEQTADGAFGHCEVETVECVHLAIALSQSFRDDRRGLVVYHTVHYTALATVACLPGVIEHTGAGDPARSVALLWRVRERPSRKGDLSVDRIVRVA